jgi:hypothetical protein
MPLMPLNRPDVVIRIVLQWQFARKRVPFCARRITSRIHLKGKNTKSTCQVRLTPVGMMDPTSEEKW